MEDVPYHPDTVVDDMSSDILSIFLDDPTLRYRMQFGDPTIDWEGDPYLEMYYGYRGGVPVYSIWRIWGGPRDPDGGMAKITERVGRRYDPGILRRLAARDSQKGFNIVKSAADKRAKVKKDLNTRRAEAAQEAASIMKWAGVS